MAYEITDECIGCGVCLPECPNEAIREKDGEFWIRYGRCTECVDDPQGSHCLRLCPVEGAVVITDDSRESREQLLNKVKRNKVKQAFLDWDALRGAESPDPETREKTRLENSGFFQVNH